LTEIDGDEIAAALHVALLREIATLEGAICAALVTLIAGILVTSQPTLPAEEVERLTALFHERLERAVAECAGAAGHA
jgi:hypothetical protein